MKHNICIVFYGLQSMFAFIVLFDPYFCEVGNSKEYCA